MSSVVLCKDERGKLAGASPADHKKWLRFLSRFAAMAIGDTLSFVWHEPRSPVFHRRFFALLNSLFDRQESFDDVDDLRTWLTCGAGHCKFVPGLEGGLCAIPESIAFHKLEQPEFQALVDKVWTFLDTERARGVLWPHASEQSTWSAIEQLRMEWR